MDHQDKQGRPRRYDVRPLVGFAHEQAAYAASALDELRERVIDQIDDLPAEALTFRPENTTLSIGVLVHHLVWAEIGWIQRITEVDIPTSLAELVTPAGKAVPAGALPPAVSQSAVELVSMCYEVGRKFTVPALQRLEDIDFVLEDSQRAMTPRGVLYHLIWHWTYHSAHIGLLRELWGSNYTWTFGPLGNTHHPER